MSNKKWDKDRTACLVELHSLKWNPHQIAAYLDVGKNAVVGKAFRLGLSWKDKHKTDAEALQDLKKEELYKILKRKRRMWV